MQPDNTKKLCSAVIDIAEKHNPGALLSAAQTIAEKFHNLFSLFGACHSIYDSTEILENTTIDDLGIKKKQLTSVPLDNN